MSTTTKLLQGISRGQESRLTCTLSTGKEFVTSILPSGNIRLPAARDTEFTPEEMLEAVAHINRTAKIAQVIALRNEPEPEQKLDPNETQRVPKAQILEQVEKDAPRR